MIRLILCQIKQLLPFVLLWAALAFMFYGLEFATDRIDEMSYLDWCSAYCDVGSDFSLVLFSIFLYMLIAYSLFPREFDEGTINFVRSLPVTNAQIFTSKVLAAWLLICLLIVAESLIHSGFLAFNTQSITGTKYWANDLILMLRNILFAFVIVSHGVFVSWFRTIGLVLYCAYLTALAWLEQSLGVTGTYNIFRFFNNEYDGQRLLLDWQVIITQCLAAGVLLAISYVMWSNRESQPSIERNSRFSKYVPVAVSMLAFVLLTATLGGMMVTTINSGGNDNILQLSTEKYRFAYRHSDQLRMQELAIWADTDYQRLADMLGIAEPPGIQADMTSLSNHALGVASYNKIRMVLTAGEPVDPVYRRVLSHETTHVLQSMESNRTLGLAGNTTGFFIEGMAQYTSFALVPDPQTQTTNWAISAVSWKRNNITFNALANRAAFESLYDPELLYGIGDIWVAAMVEQCGESSLGNFLRSIGNPGAPKTLAGTAYWRHHLVQINCSLEEVNHGWRQIMQSIVDEGTGGAFPAFENVSTAIRDNYLVINAQAIHDTDQKPGRYYIRVAGETKLASTVSPIRLGRFTDADDTTEVEYLVPLGDIEGKRFSFQLGYVPFKDSRYYFEKWRSGSLPQ